MATKSKNAKKKNEQVTANNSRRQIMSIIWFAVAVFIFFMLIFPGGKVGSVIHNVMLGMFGAMAYAFPVLLAAVAVLSACKRYVGSVSAKAIESCVLVALIGACIDIFKISGDEPIEKFITHIVSAYNSGVKSGGVLGAVIGHPLYLAFEKKGALIAVFLLIFVFLLLITGTTLVGFFKNVAKPVKKIGEHTENTFADNEERENSQSRGKGKVIDIPVDDIPLKRKRTENNISLDDKQRKVVETYRGFDEKSKDNEDTSAKKIPIVGVNYANNDEKPVKEVEKLKLSSAETAKEINTVDKEISDGMHYTETDGYRFPPISLLNEAKPSDNFVSKAELDMTAEHLVETLRSFGVETKIVAISRGPTVTRYELQPCAGVKISKITNLADDIALNLAAVGVRIEAPIPGKAAVGIEVPNKNKTAVSIREILDSDVFNSSKSKLTVALGKDIGGSIVVTDLSKMPHLLIAGTTGSGKSVCVNSMIMSILYKSSPEDVKLLMIDPKVVEMQIYNGIPHLLVPVVTEARKASGALGWAVMEMERRYKMFAENGARDIQSFNKIAENNENLEKMPQIVIVIDELADLMMVAANEVEDYICRIAQKARAAGMHLVIATQRPSVDVVTGLIKANIPSRIALSVSSQIDSRTILDMSGAEKLIGYGDMLFSPVGATKPERIQGCFVSDSERESVISYIKGEQESEYDSSIMEEIERQAAQDKKQKVSSDGDDVGDDDPMLNQAIEVVVELGQASTSLLQRKLKLGYSRAARIMDQMYEKGIIGAYEGSKPRQVLITKTQLMEMKANEE